MFLAFQHCQPEMLPGMHQHSPSKRYVSEIKQSFLTSKQTNKILIWQLLSNLTLHSSPTDKRSDTELPISKVRISSHSSSHFTKTQKSFQKAILIGEKN